VSDHRLNFFGRSTVVCEARQSGFAQAVRETGLVDAPTIADWRAVSRTAAIVGHADTLALPPAG